MKTRLDNYQWFSAILRGESPLLSDLKTDSSEEDLWQTGLENGVLALANHKLADSETETSLPQTFRERLKKYAFSIAATEFVREYELRLALSQFTDIPFLIMKGTALAYSHYSHPYLRSRCDTDLLFASKADAEQAWQRLRTLGYRRPNAVSGKFVSHEFSCLKKSKMDFEHVLDIHWKLSNSHRFARALTFKEMHDSAIPVTEVGEQALALNPTHSLLLACMHRIAHKPEATENRLIWLSDIQLLSDKFSSTQWQQFVTLAVKRNLCGICLDGLQQTAATFSCDIAPKEVISVLYEGARNEKYSTEMGKSRLAMELSTLR